MKKIITLALIAIMVCIMAGCETHSHSTVTTHGVDIYGNRYTMVNEYIDDVLISSETIYR